MRKRWAVQVGLIGCLVLLARPADAPGQPSFGGRGGGGGGGPRMMMGNPSQMFDFMARGRPYILIAEMNRLREPLTQFAQQQGITNGQITREQFAAFSEQMKGKMMSGGAPGMAPPGAPGARPNPAPGQPDTPGATSPDQLRQWAEWEFKRRDQNGDGMLNSDEMPDTLRAELSRWDANNDSLIDLNEFIPYMQARMQQRAQQDSQQWAPAASIVEEEDLDRRPVVFRAGKLPKELPAWFQECDTDSDGQVSLYEWRKANKSIEQFQELDRNQDGFLTAEEVLRNQALAKASAPRAPAVQVAGAASAALAPAERAPDSGTVRPTGRGPGMGGGGRGKGKRDR